MYLYTAQNRVITKIEGAGWRDVTPARPPPKFKISPHHSIVRHLYGFG